MGDNNPCRYCVPPKRQPGCHAWCEDGIAWGKEYHAKQERIKAEKQKDCAVTDTIMGLEEKVKQKGNRR